MSRNDGVLFFRFGLSLLETGVAGATFALFFGVIVADCVDVATKISFGLSVFSSLEPVPSSDEDDDVAG